MVIACTFYEKYCVNDMDDQYLSKGIQQNMLLQCSTRGIGFVVVSTVCSVEAVYESPPPQDVPVFQLYRVSLALLESKMANVYSSYDDCYIFRNDFRSTLYSVSQMPKMISAIIDSLGTFTHRNTKFVPIMAPDRYDNNKILIPDAGSVYYSNLRSVVSSLSDSRTPFEARKWFVQENSIPGARFSADCILENPDEIMPDGYDNNQLLRDIQDVRRFFSKVESNHMKWISPCPNLDSGEGMPFCAVASKRSLFIESASDFASLQCKRPQNNDMKTLYSPIKLKPHEWLLGGANFLREPPACHDDRYPFWEGCYELHAPFYARINDDSSCIYNCYGMRIKTTVN